VVTKPIKVQFKEGIHKYCTKVVLTHLNFIKKKGGEEERRLGFQTEQSILEDSAMCSSFCSMNKYA